MSSKQQKDKRGHVPASSPTEEGPPVIKETEHAAISSSIRGQKRQRSESKSEPTSHGKQRRVGENGKPKRPLSAYNFYFQEERKRLLESHARGEIQEDFLVREGKEPSEAVFQAVSRTVANRWKNISDQDKAPYYQRAKVEMGKYREEMEEYKQKIIDSSNLAKSMAASKRGEVETTKEELKHAAVDAEPLGEDVNHPPTFSGPRPWSLPPIQSRQESISAIFHPSASRQTLPDAMNHGSTQPSLGNHPSLLAASAPGSAYLSAPVAGQIPFQGTSDISRLLLLQQRNNACNLLQGTSKYSPGLTTTSADSFVRTSALSQAQTSTLLSPSLMLELEKRQVQRRLALLQEQYVPHSSQYAQSFGDSSQRFLPALDWTPNTAAASSLQGAMGGDYPNTTTLHYNDSLHSIVNASIENASATL